MSRNIPTKRAELAAEVRAAIARAGTNATAISAGTGIPASTLYKRLAGESAFSTDELIEVARHLDVDVREFFPRSQKAVA
jgi:predicted transcriptional regulator